MTKIIDPHNISDTKLQAIQLEYLDDGLHIGKTVREISVLKEAFEQVRLTAFEQGRRDGYNFAKFQINEGYKL